MDHLALFEAAAAQMTRRLTTTDPARPVPTCPGWSVLDLVTHLGNVHAWAATVVETGAAAPGQEDRPPSGRSGSLTEWYAAKVEDLAAVLREAPPARPCWNFAFGEGTVAFWPRRQLHETTMHGVDVDLAVGLRPQIDPAVAADGVDEALRVFLVRMHARGFPARLDRPLALVAPDQDRSWTLSPAPDAAPTVADGCQADDVVSAPAVALYALLWKRLPTTDAAIDLVGDNARLEAFLGSRVTA